MARIPPQVGTRRGKVGTRLVRPPNRIQRRFVAFKNLKRGIPFRSKYSKYVEEAIGLRKSSEATWREIAQTLSEKHGVKIPTSSLHRAVEVRLRMFRERQQLPDLDAQSETPSQIREEAATRLAPAPVTDDLDDFSDMSDTLPKIKINRRKK